MIHKVLTTCALTLWLSGCMVTPIIVLGAAGYCAATSELGRDYIQSKLSDGSKVISCKDMLSD